MKVKTYFITVTWAVLSFLFLIQGLVACTSNVVQPAANDSNITQPSKDDGEPAVFTDADIDTAEVSLATETLDIANLDLTADSDLSTQKIIRGASGYVYFIGDDPSADKPWKVRRFNQSVHLDKPIVYRGKREIQSVAGTLDGNTLIVSMKETIQGSSDYEIYKLVIDPPSVKKLTNNDVPDINVSIGRSGSRKVWESSVGGKATVYLRIGNQETVLSHSHAQKEPSISGNGKYIALIRKSASGKRIKIYKIGSDTYEDVVTDNPTKTKHSPSVSDAGNKVLWLEPGVTNKIKLINLTTNITTEEVSSTNGLNHPHLTADSYSFGYSEELVGVGGWRIFTKNILKGTTKQGTESLSDIDHTGAYWQKTPVHEIVIVGATPNTFSLDSGDFTVTASPQDEQNNFLADSVSKGNFSYKDIKLTGNGINQDLQATVTAINIITANSPDSDGISVMLVFDTSGSMFGSVRDLRSAGVNFINLLSANDKAAVMRFSSGHTLLTDFTSDKETLKQKIKSLGASGGTHMYKALSAALDEMVGQANPAIVVLTDGISFDRNQRSTVISKAKSLNVPIFTIGLGSGIRADELQKLASKTGGTYAFGANSSQLTQIYKNISFGLRGRVEVQGKVTFNPSLTTNGNYQLAGILATSIGGNTIEKSFGFTVQIPNTNISTLDYPLPAEDE